MDFVRRADTEYNLIQELVQMKVGEYDPRHFGASHVKPSSVPLPQQHHVANGVVNRPPMYASLQQSPPMPSPQSSTASSTTNSDCMSTSYKSNSACFAKQVQPAADMMAAAVMYDRLVQMHQHQQRPSLCNYQVYDQLCALINANGGSAVPPPPASAGAHPMLLPPMHHPLMHHRQPPMAGMFANVGAPALVPPMVVPSASAQLQSRLDECAEQYRQLEKERKKTEAELARANLGKRINSTNNIAIPRLPAAPSRLDRLIVDYFREHARVVTLLSRIEQLLCAQLPARVHQTMAEWMNALKQLQQCRYRERTVPPTYDGMRPVNCHGAFTEASMIAAFTSVTFTARRARAASWCSLMQCLHRTAPSMPADIADKIQQLVKCNYDAEPPAIQIKLDVEHANAAASSS